jgi:hypothetical protein
MADTIRTKSALTTLYADSTTGSITAQNGRDFLLSAMNLWPVAIKATSYIATVDDVTLFCDTSTASMTVTLPTISASNNAGKLFCIKKVVTSNVVTISASSTDTLEDSLGNLVNSTSISVKGTSVSYQNDGASKWYLI